MEDFVPFLGVQGDSTVNPDGFFSAELLKVGNGQKPHVRRVVPLIADPAIAPWRAALPGEDLAKFGKSEVRETHDTDATDPQDFVDDPSHVTNGLQRLGQDHRVKLLVGKRPQSLV